MKKKTISKAVRLTACVIASCLLLALAGCASAPGQGETLASQSGTAAAKVQFISASDYIYDPLMPPVYASLFIYDDRFPPVRGSAFLTEPQ